MEVRHYFPQAPDSLFSDGYEVHDKTQLLVERMGITYIPDWQTEDYVRASNTFYLNTDFDDQLDISGYDMLIPFDYNQALESATKSYDSLEVTFDATLNLLQFFRGREKIGAIRMAPSLSAWKEKYPGNTYDYDIPAEELTIIEESNHYRFKLYLRTLDTTEEAGKFNIYIFYGTILIGKK